MKVRLGADGTVKNVQVIKGLPDGLNEKAVEAAYKLKFDPARDAAGEPVDVSLTVSVNFSIRTEMFTGSWYTPAAGEGGGLQFFLWPDKSKDRRGFVIFERSPGEFVWAPVTGTVRNDGFEMAATSGSTKCTYRWTGLGMVKRVEVVEVRTCAGQAGTSTRTLVQ